MPEHAADANRNLHLRRTGPHSPFDFTPSARCSYPTKGIGPHLLLREVENATECEALCATTPRCIAAQYNHPTCNATTREEVEKSRDRPCHTMPTCVLRASCLERIRAGPPERADVYHRWGPTWPPAVTPSTVQWHMNATLVIVSYKASLAYLRTLPGNIMDIVVYHKADSGNPNITYNPMTRASCQQQRSSRRRQQRQQRSLHRSQRSSQRSSSQQCSPISSLILARVRTLSHLATQSDANPCPASISRSISRSISPASAANYVLSHLREQEMCGSSSSSSSSSSKGGGGSARSSRSSNDSTYGSTLAKYGYAININDVFRPNLGRLHYPSQSQCRLGCVCGKRTLANRPRLAYFATLPNYGLTHKEPHGGSREPYGYLQFILDFWDNLPPVVVFSQDDCLARGCMWGMLLPGLAKRFQHWQKEWREGVPITQKNCLCKYIREDTYRNKVKRQRRLKSLGQPREARACAPCARCLRALAACVRSLPACLLARPGLACSDGCTVSSSACAWEGLLLVPFHVICAGALLQLQPEHAKHHRHVATGCRLRRGARDASFPAKVDVRAYAAAGDG